MKLTSGYHFFHDGKGCGFVLVKVFKNMVKIQCVLDHLPTPQDLYVNLCLAHSAEDIKPYIIGKIYLPANNKSLKGQGNFSIRDLTNTFWDKYNYFTVQDPQGNVILKTHLPAADFHKEKPKKPFDPFKTTNNAYSWDRAESSEELYYKTEKEQVKLSSEILAEARSALSKYKHVLLGKYTAGSKVYFILGIPGERPQAEENAVYRWINKVISLEEYPYFHGYKLYYIDKESSALVKAVLRTQPTGQ